MIHIVTDTTAVLPQAVIDRYGITVVPQVIRFGDESYLEGVELEEAQFLSRLVSSATLPATSAPPPAMFAEAYRCAAEHGDIVLSIHPSAEVSGTLESAFVARSQCPQADIRIIDSRTVAGCLASIVQLAADWAASGVCADKIIDRINALAPRARTYFLVATLEYLQKNGRIGGAAKLIGSALQIKPILQIIDGHVEPFEKVRTHHKALERIREIARTECPRTLDAHLCVMHADAPSEANQLRADLCADLGVCDIPLYSVGPAITTHAGPGTLAIGYFVAN
jgi:fatty acid kinase fatty acid binding subunit